ncbi:MAG: fumarylacetoacetate hydrolase family protein [Lachnospiraceae bacterium]|nr:fumarylacetoacetate hydrolase family protein [Lachnospiraceae bacterium]
MNVLIDQADRALPVLKEAAVKPAAEQVLSFAPEEVRILSPIPSLRQDMICLGVNYDEHIRETVHVEDFQHKEATVYFSKRAYRVSGPEDPIPEYDFVDSLDYEVELGVVIGKTVKGCSVEEAKECIFGYSVVNDVSGRNLQFKHKQWYMGKGQDGYTVMGPCIVTADEIPDPQNLSIVCRVNGEVRQSSNTKYMIQPVAEAIAELAQGITLIPGTVIATGTPGGVALGMKEPKWLHEGDVVECEVEKIGVLTNPVKKA